MALGIDKSHNGFDLTKGEGCYLIDSTANYKIGVSTRINIDYAEEWKEKPWRFFVEGNAYVSKK
jgi:DNA-3-methyladenine glycosylase